MVTVDIHNHEFRSIKKSVLIAKHLIFNSNIFTIRYFVESSKVDSRTQFLRSTSVDISLRNAAVKARITVHFLFHSQGFVCLFSTVRISLNPT